MDHGLNNFTVFSGLDPAGPLFEGYDPKVRLDQGDAEYVDVIHSNGESLIVGGFGAWEPMGINLFKISIMLNIKLSTILYNIWMWCLRYDSFGWGINFVFQVMLTFTPTAEGHNAVVSICWSEDSTISSIVSSFTIDSRDRAANN